MKTKHNPDFPDSNCEIDGCKNVATKIIRTKLVCGQCYKILLRDNIYRFERDMDITTSLEIYKACYKYKCIKKTFTILKYDSNGELQPKYCSEECEIKDQEIINKFRYDGFIRKKTDTA